VALVTLSVAAAFFSLPVETIGSRFGGIPQALPAFALPDFSWETAKQLMIPTVTIALLGAIDSWIYDNCPGTQVPVTAIDYEYQGMPATLKAGVNKFKFTNTAPKEDHMIAIAKLTPAAQGKDVQEILALPEKKQAKYVDQADGAFAYATAGQTGYSPAALTPGTYMYACFLPVGGKKNGAPHFTEGMYGTFTVQ
jgi:hypothetical protein